METQSRKKIIRNLIIMYVGTLLLATGGGLIMASGQDAGGLLFILSPLIMVLIARFALRDGWRDAGLRLNLRESWGWYLFVLLFFLLVYPLVIAINVGFGFTTLTRPIPELLPLLLTGVATQFVPRMLYALSEEWAWRGYLEPRFTALGIPDTRRYLIVGLLWAIWHFPLILGTDYTAVPLALFLPLFVISLMPLAFIYGPMWKSSRSVWPAVILHGLGNTFGYAILQGELIAFDNELLGSIAAGSLTVTVIWALIALGIAWGVPRVASARPAPASA